MTREASLDEANQQLVNMQQLSTGLCSAQKLKLRGFDVVMSGIQENVWFISKGLDRFTLTTPEMIDYDLADKGPS